LRVNEPSADAGRAVAGTASGLSELLPGRAVRLGVRAADWRAAVRAAGAALALIGAASERYAEEMVAVVEQLGPYIVIAPGIALAHARPSPEVFRPALSWVGLAAPVSFGHDTNDPVRVVIALAATDVTSHVAALRTLAGLLEDPARRRALLAAPHATAVRSIIARFEAGCQPWNG
jgi:PTS system ascorbate-specific IIA component